MRLEEIRKRYNITSNDLKEIKVQLKTKIKENHPDNNNHFDSDYFSELNNDLEYVENLISDSKNQNTLVPMSEVIHTLAEILQTPVKKDEDLKEVLNEKLSENIQNRLLISKKRLRIPRITSTTMAAVITFLWMFPNKAMEHPLIQILFGDTGYAGIIFAMVITIVWLSALICAIIIWVSSIRREKMEKEIMDRVKLESVQNKFFMRFLDYISPDKKFSKLDFMEYLSYEMSREYFYELSRGYSANWSRKQRKKQRKTLHFNSEEELVQNMTDIILLRAKEYEIITVSKPQGLIECYEIIQDEGDFKIR